MFPFPQPLTPAQVKNAPALIQQLQIIIAQRSEMTCQTLKLRTKSESNRNSVKHLLRKSRRFSSNQQKLGKRQTRFGKAKFRKKSQTNANLREKRLSDITVSAVRLVTVRRYYVQDPRNLCPKKCIQYIILWIEDCNIKNELIKNFGSINTRFIIVQTWVTLTFTLQCTLVWQHYKCLFNIRKTKMCTCIYRILKASNELFYIFNQNSVQKTFRSHLTHAKMSTAYIKFTISNFGV